MGKEKQISYCEVANEFSINLIFAIADHYRIDIARVIKVLDKIKYWDVINNDIICCTAAHDGLSVIIKELDGEINEVLSRN